MHPEIQQYHQQLPDAERQFCEQLYTLIQTQLPDAENKIWHRHPVWFLDGNPIVGYDKLKNCVRLLFWSGQSFEEEILQAEGKFKAAEIRYIDPFEMDEISLIRCLQKSREIQWDYKNIVKRKGQLIRL